MRRRKTKWCENSESWWRLWPWDDLKTELFPTELTKIDQKKAYWSLMTENGNQNRSWKVSKDHDSGSDSERTRRRNLTKDHDSGSDSERTRRRNLTKDHDSSFDSERTRRRNPPKRSCPPLLESAWRGSMMRSRTLVSFLLVRFGQFSREWFGLTVLSGSEPPSWSFLTFRLQFQFSVSSVGNGSVLKSSQGQSLHHDLC